MYACSYFKIGKYVMKGWVNEDDFVPSIFLSRLMPGSFHLSFFVSFDDEVTKVSCHFQAKTVQLFFSFFVKTKNER